LSRQVRGRVVIVDLSGVIDLDIDVVVESGGRCIDSYVEYGVDDF
jgi:hypothetical protein